MMKFFSTLLLMSVAACTAISFRGKTHEQLLFEVDSIAIKCSPSQQVKFELVGTKLLRVLPTSAASFKEVECFLAGVQPYHFDLGFIGNEAADPR